MTRQYQGLLTHETHGVKTIVRTAPNMAAASKMLAADFPGWQLEGLVNYLCFAAPEDKQWLPRLEWPA